MKIGLVSPYDYPFPGGVTEHIANLARELVRRGHDVRVIAPSSALEEALVQEDGVQVHRVGSIVRVPIHGSWARVSLSPRVFRRVQTLLEEETFDLLHLHEPLLPLLPLAVLWYSRAANVGTFHAYWERSRYYAFWRPLLRPFFRRLHARIAVSQAARGYVARYFPDEYHIIPNGVDVHHFRPDVPPLEDYADGRPTVVFVGRLEPRKGFGYLLRAFRALKQAEPRARLLVAGAYSTSDRYRWQAVAASLGVRDVVFLGQLSRSELAHCYATATVCCFPSTGGESFGIVLLEAMASGRAVVATAIPGYSEVVRHEVEGLLVPPRDPAALALALLRLLRDDAFRARLEANARARAEEFAWERVADRVLEVYMHARERAGGTAAA
jgi:phosphatidylinositol alpha-mannosyltransferase